MKEELLKHYDYLTRLAVSKYSSQQDAEDLVSETMLAAYSFMSRGGVIEHPKTWLANTLMHKFNNSMRKKYRAPVTVNFDMLTDVADEECAFDEEDDEAASLRRELTYLARTTREVLIRYYFNGDSVREIASALKIPEGTVKSRLSAGRGQIRKGLEQMENEKNNLPGKLNISFSGRDGRKGEPISLVEGDLIAQNLLILAYDKPLTLPELGKAIGIPTVYIEPIVEKLVSGELMVHTDGDKYYTDFIIYKPEDNISAFDRQKSFAKENFDRFWSALDELIGGIGTLGFVSGLGERQITKLERYAVMLALQGFQVDGLGKDPARPPARRDGGAWLAMGWSFPAGFDFAKAREISEYSHYGHRDSGGECDFHGAKHLRLCEFDTSLWDRPCRFAACGGYENYFDGAVRLLWSVFKGKTPEECDISDALIGSIPGFVNIGLLSDSDGALAVDIPVLRLDEYEEVRKLSGVAKARLIEELGKDYREFTDKAAVKLPSHLKSVSEFSKYLPATGCIPMAVVREAYGRGLHLRDVDYCCPPAVLVYEE